MGEGDDRIQTNAQGGKPPPLPRVVVSFDPGGTTGYALIRIGRTRNHAPKILKAGTFRTRKFLKNFLTGIAERNGNRFELLGIIVEDFKLYPKMAKHLFWDRAIAPRWIGAIEQSVYEHQLPGSCLQMPHERGSMLRHPLVKAVRNKHARDAVAHALHWLVKQGYWNGRMD